MALIYTGIDEAGYGPMLGPLCVASVTLKIDAWSPGEPAPDVWASLGEAICKTKRDAKRRIAVGDSKDLKLSNKSKAKHPLYHLERGVLAFLAARAGCHPDTDAELFEELGATLDQRAWYSGEPIPLPLGISCDLLGIEANQLKGAMHKAGVELLDIRVRVVGEQEFNDLYARHQTKAAATGIALRELLECSRSHERGDAESRVVCDRQSGRTRYSKMLKSLYHDVQIEEESARASRYRCDERTAVLLTPGADQAYFPVALASMAAKLVRELAMMRFNRYWSNRIPELKPTAGYVQDARRWLKDAEHVLEESERKELIRMA